MMNLLAEAVIMSFAVGGIVGALVALQLRGDLKGASKSSVESSMKDSEQLVAKQVVVTHRNNRHPNRRK
ncbi:MAG: hypothetical protein ACE5EH_00695 [Gammaproteobacteria bacterium]